MSALGQKRTFGKVGLMSALPPRRQRVEDYLLACCEANGLLADDGLVQCQATLASGIRAGALRPYHDIGSERSEDGS